MPLNVCDKKRGMLMFVKSFTEVGQSYEPSFKVDVRRLLPCGEKLRRGIMELCQAMREDLKKNYL